MERCRALPARHAWVPLAAVTVMAWAPGAGAQAPARDTARRSAVAGVVSDTTGRPLPMVTVIAHGQDANVVTDSAGRFHLDVPSGDHNFTLMRLGYRAVHFEATLPPDTTVVLNVRMRAIDAMLAPVQVTGELISARLLRDGFYDRRERGMGAFLSPAQVEDLEGRVTQTSQMLRMVNGISVRCPVVGPCAVTANNCLTYWVDGSRRTGVLLDEVTSPRNVYAVEVYARRHQVPLEFADAYSRCGAIVVWTKSRAP